MKAAAEGSVSRYFYIPGLSAVFPVKKGCGYMTEQFEVSYMQFSYVSRWVFFVMSLLPPRVSPK